MRTAPSFTGLAGCRSGRYRGAALADPGERLLEAFFGAPVSGERAERLLGRLHPGAHAHLTAAQAMLDENPRMGADAALALTR